MHRSIRTLIIRKTEIITLHAYNKATNQVTATAYPSGRVHEYNVPDETIFGLLREHITKDVPTPINITSSIYRNDNHMLSTITKANIEYISRYTRFPDNFLE